MSDKTYIWNLALIRLGALPILDPDSDTSKKAMILRTVYDGSRDLALADHPWKFALRRATLAQDATAPLFGYTYAFVPPADNLRILGLCHGHTSSSGWRGNDHDVDPRLRWKSEGGRVLTNVNPCNVLYIIRVTDEGAFTPGFVSAFADRLAAEAAFGITGNGSLKNEIMNEYQNITLPKAKALDSQEGTPEVYETNPWIDARY